MRAEKTLAAIELMLEKDQGAKYRQLLKKYMLQADDPFRGEESPFRSHLGASIAGKECAREIWYSFRWAVKPHFPGRILRLFNRGHLEEPRMLALLEMIGCEVHSATAEGKQFRMKRGLVGGSLDGVVKGIPEIPNDYALTEFKTHSEKSFLKLKDEGVMRSKWEHFIQQQLYMGWQGLNYSLYMAANKNSDEIYAEIVCFDKAVFGRFDNRAQSIVVSPVPPPRISNDPTFFKCKFCAYKDICQGSSKAYISCRTCFSVEINANEVRCGLKGKLLTEMEQVSGCSSYEGATAIFKAKP